MHPYSAPNAAPRPDEDYDLQHVNPTFPKIAAGFTLLAGALGILNAIQTLITVGIRPLIWSLVPYVLIATGAAIVYFAKGVFTARRWAAIGGVVSGACLAVLSAAWLYFAVTNGFIALYAIWTPMAALLAVALCAASLPACDRATSARDRLAAQGMNIGL